MSILKVKPLIDDFYNLDLSEKNRQVNYICARSIYYKIMRDYYHQTYQDMGSSLGKDHASAMHIYKRFNYYNQNYKSVSECYREVRLKLGLIQAEPEDLVKDFDVNQHVKECLTYLVQLNDNELKAFIPRIDLYLKSVKYNRKKQQEWKSKQAKVSE